MRRPPSCGGRHKIIGLQQLCIRMCASVQTTAWGRRSIGDGRQIFSGAFRGLLIVVFNPISRSDEILSTEQESTSCNPTYTHRITQLVSAPRSGSRILVHIPTAAKRAPVHPTKIHPIGPAIDSSNGVRAARRLLRLRTTMRGSPVERGQHVFALS